MELKYIDEPEMYRDAPICLQLVGRRYEDEKVRIPTHVTLVWEES
jgi:hypothetical protein